MTDPTCTEVQITASAGGKVQIVQYKLFNEFGFTQTESYSMPEDWTPEDIEAWKDEKTKAIKGEVDAYAQIEQDALLANSDWYAQ